MSANKPIDPEGDTDARLWEAYVAVFRPSEWAIDLTTPCLEHQCHRIGDIGAVFQRLQQNPDTHQPPG